MALALRDRGYSHAHPMLGGFNLWREKGYPVTEKRGEVEAT